MSYNPKKGAAARLDARIDALAGYREALFLEEARVKLLLEDSGQRIPDRQRAAYFESDPAWRQARDRYRAAVASAERAWFLLHPHPGQQWGTE